MSMGKVVEGVFAVNKPSGISSAQVLRDLQKHFNPSKLFAPWLELERINRSRDSRNQRRYRRDKNIQVKIGHGGTLDPLATGVLIAGVGRGTKSLQEFLTCTKEYEATILFGTGTDTYDRVGKVLKRAPYEHIKREIVENALENFRGKFMQLPPIFSALKMNGKPLYEYAREGKSIPREIERRPVEVFELKLVEWMEGGTHPHVAPTEEAGYLEVNVANELRKHAGIIQDKTIPKSKDNSSGTEKYQIANSSDSAILKGNDVTKHDFQKSLSESTLAPGQNHNLDQESSGEGFLNQKKRKRSNSQNSSASNQSLLPENNIDKMDNSKNVISSDGITYIPTAAAAIGHKLDSKSKQDSPPAARLRMVVTSGFYVRSLCHDLGLAVGSIALMAELKRTRQGEFQLGKNTLDYVDLEKGEEIWGPKVELWLSEWEEKHSAHTSRSQRDNPACKKTQSSEIVHDRVNKEINKVSSYRETATVDVEYQSQVVES